MIVPPEGGRPSSHRPPAPAHPARPAPVVWRRRLRLPAALAAAVCLTVGCAAPPAATARAPGQAATAFIQTRVAVLLTEGAAPATPVAGGGLPKAATSTPAPTQGPAPSPTAEGPASPTAGPDLKAPCPDQACAAAAEHFWLARPVPAEGNAFIDRTYPYGSTQQGMREPHHGVEFVNPAGTPVLAAAAGRVVVAGDDALQAFGPAVGFYGNLVVVQLDDSLLGQPVFNLYGHLSSVAVAVGQTVRLGEALGAVGQTGVAIGPHLHFEVRVGENGYAHTRNPELWLAPKLDADGRPYGAIAARIADSAGQPVPGQLVVIRPVSVNEPTRTRYLTTYADDTLNGDDRLQENLAAGDLPAGTYSVSVSTTRFYETTVTVEPGHLTWVTLAVKTAAP